ncbi:MAG TPA: alkaline phosphatase family protein [Streptosporangiaceae bacterium]|nr:alkaline phosphatase family protein [Streptosporangiaceae bacterium]
MRTRHALRAMAVAGIAALLSGGAVTAASAAPGHPAHHAHPGGAGAHARVSHVLLLSVDGLHQADLAWYVKNFPRSALASLAGAGVEYSSAQTPVPSDSFPGLIGQVTGGDPGVTGVYYDDTWNHDVFPAGTNSCTGPAPGGEVAYTEADDIDQTSLDAGQGLSGLPGTILQMTANPVDVINPAALPVDPSTCKPIYPNSYLKVNTIFEVARQHGLRTAWSDKHPAYLAVSGPSGTGVQDYFTPEINSQAIGFPAGEDWTNDNAATMQYDTFKVQAVLNEIDGFDHSRAHHVGVPAIFGMNFQTVSTAQKLPTSDGLTGGYLPGGNVPGPLLVRALNYVNTEVGAMVAEIRAQGLAGSTAIILSAKHGQSPTDPNDLARVPDGPIIDGLNAAWRAAHPGAGDLVSFATDDDVMQLWLSDRSQAAADFAKQYLLTHAVAGNDVNGNPVTVSASGLKAVYAGAASAAFFGVRNGDPRHPDVFGIVRHGVVYTGGKGKIAEHGGADRQDRHVPILVVPPGLRHGRAVGAPVETTQIAPTILTLLGLSPSDLQAVQIEHTRVLPSLRGSAGH